MTTPQTATVTPTRNAVMPMTVSSRPAAAAVGEAVGNAVGFAVGDSVGDSVGDRMLSGWVGLSDFSRLLRSDGAPWAGGDKASGGSKWWCFASAPAAPYQATYLQHAASFQARNIPPAALYRATHIQPPAPFSGVLRPTLLHEHH